MNTIIPNRMIIVTNLEYDCNIKQYIEKGRHHIYLKLPSTFLVKEGMGLLL